MCTVTFIPTEDGFYFTSNRDEKSSRETIPPRLYSVGELELFFPKNVKAGGTWFAVNKHGRAACLLNGAFVNHIKLDKHTKSRGQLLLDSFTYPNAKVFSEAIELENVEPFTLLMLDYSSGTLNQFVEIRWDGEKKYVKQLSTTTPQIWSSVTLYNPEVQEKRNNLFSNWIENNSDSKNKNIMNFHFSKHGFNNEDAIFMSREGDLKTISISQLIIEKGKSDFIYKDVLNEKEFTNKIY